MNETGGGGRSGIKNRVLCRCIAAGCASRWDCWHDQMRKRIALLLYTIKYITYGFTAALLRREHRRSPILLLCGTSEHVHETIDDLSKISRNTHPSSVSRFWLGCLKSHVWVWGSPLPGVLWSFPVLKYSKKRRKKSTHWKTRQHEKQRWAFRLVPKLGSAVKFTRISDLWAFFAKDCKKDRHVLFCHKCCKLWILLATYSIFRYIISRDIYIFKINFLNLIFSKFFIMTNYDS